MNVEELVVFLLNGIRSVLTELWKTALTNASKNPRLAFSFCFCVLVVLVILKKKVDQIRAEGNEKTKNTIEETKKKEKKRRKGNPRKKTGEIDRKKKKDNI